MNVEEAREKEVVSRVIKRERRNPRRPLPKPQQLRVSGSHSLSLSYSSPFHYYGILYKQTLRIPNYLLYCHATRLSSLTANISQACFTLLSSEIFVFFFLFNQY